MDMKRFDGKSACVTGAARGIGAAIARRLAAEGAAVAVVDMDLGAARATASALAASTGAKVVAVGGDLSDKAAADSAMADALASLGRLDILVNNAGGGVIRPTLDHDEHSVRTTIDRNLMTMLWCTLGVIPTMLDAGYGRVINIGAESVRNGLFDHAVYNAAKGGVHAICSALAREFSASGITFNAVAPSIVTTESVEAMLREQPERAGASWRDAVSLIPLGRPASLDEVASAVVYLASDEAAFITGQVLSVNGGSSMG